MARARSPNSVEAEKMYRSGMKLVDIAKKNGSTRKHGSALEKHTKMG